MQRGFRCFLLQRSVLTTGRPLKGGKERLFYNLKTYSFKQERGRRQRGKRGDSKGEPARPPVRGNHLTIHNLVSTYTIQGQVAPRMTKGTHFSAGAEFVTAMLNPRLGCSTCR